MSSYISPSSPGSGGRTTTGQKKIHYVTCDVFYISDNAKIVTEFNEMNEVIEKF